MHPLFSLILSLIVALGLAAEEYNGPTNLSLKVVETLTIHGPAQLKMVKAQTLSVTGPLTFNHLDISGDATLTGTVTGFKGKFGALSVTGPMDVDHLICEELTVIGPVKAKFLEVTGKADITGDLDVEESKFASLTVKGEKIFLNGVVIDTLTVKEGTKHQTVRLQGASIVNGDILFESGRGIVDASSPDVQIKGVIKGGTRK